jgi:hypothetical protein
VGVCELVVTIKEIEEELGHKLTANQLATVAEVAAEFGMSINGVVMALKGLGEQVKKVAPTDYSKHLGTKPITAGVHTSKSVAGEKIAESVTQDKTLHPGVFTNGMSITVEGGRVINLGNYETARIGVSITVPCAKDSLEDAYKYATDWVSSKIEEAVAETKA